MLNYSYLCLNSVNIANYERENIFRVVERYDCDNDYLCDNNHRIVAIPIQGVYRHRLALKEDWCCGHSYFSRCCEYIPYEYDSVIREV